MKGVPLITLRADKGVRVVSGPSRKQTREKRQEEERKAKQRSARTKAIGWSFAALLQILALIPSLPLEPYGIAFIIVSVALAIYLSWIAEFTETLLVKEKLFGAWCIVLWVVVVGSIVLPFKWESEKAAATEGFLYLQASHASEKLIELGEGGHLLLDTMSDANSSTDPLFVFFQDTSFSLENDNGHLLVSTIIRDQQGKIVVQLDRNHWRVNADKGICFDKNYTTDSLEVQDGRGHVIFQLRLYPDRVQFQGIWFNEKGAFREMVVDKQHLGGSIIQIVEDPTNHPAPEILIDPIFKYPSDKHWAEWELKGKRSYRTYQSNHGQTLSEIFSDICGQMKSELFRGGVVGSPRATV